MKEYAVMPKKDYVELCDWIREHLATDNKIKSGELLSMLNEVISFTDDADATAEDMVEGKSSWVKGKKIYGSVPEVKTGITARVTPSQSNSDIKLSFRSDIDYLIRERTLFTVFSSLSNYGNVLPEEVAAGKIFTSAAGLNEIGTMPNNGKVAKTMDGINIKSVSIPAGYTSGGSVSLDSTIDDEVDEQADLIAQIMDAVDSLPEASAGGNQNAGEWIGLSSLPTTYAADPDGTTYYLPIEEGTIGFIVFNKSTNRYAAYTINGVQVDAAAPNLSSYTIVTDGNERYFSMTIWGWNDASNLFVLPIYECKN